MNKEFTLELIAEAINKVGIDKCIKSIGNGLYKVDEYTTCGEKSLQIIDETRIKKLCKLGTMKERLELFADDYESKLEKGVFGYSSEDIKNAIKAGAQYMANEIKSSINIMINNNTKV